jgi:hypothetical protein
VPSKQGADAGWVSYPLKPFEDAVMGRLLELKASEVLPAPDGGDRVESLRGRLAEAEANVKRYKANSEESEEAFAVYADKAVEWEGKRKRLDDELKAAEAEATSPLADGWGRFKAAGQLLFEQNTDEVRLLCRDALRRTVERVLALFVPGAGLRVAAVEVQFKGGDGRRVYVIAHRPAASNGKTIREGKTLVWSAAELGRPSLDLGVPEKAKELELLLAVLVKKAMGKAGG